MLKLKKITTYALLCSTMLCSSFTVVKHPFYVTVVDVKYVAKQHILQLCVRMFANDIEVALRKQTHQPIDVLHPKNKPMVDSLLANYINQRLTVRINNTPTTLVYVGNEQGEEGSLWTYIEIEKVAEPKVLKIKSSLLLDYFPKQINIIHTDVNGTYKSYKLTNPSSEAVFNY